MAFFEQITGSGGDLGSSLVKVAGIAFAGIFAKNAFTYVPPEFIAFKSYGGEVARNRHGEAKRHTGLTYVNPFRGKLHQVDLRDRTTAFPDFEVEMYRDGRLMKHNVGSAMFWRVLADGENPVRAEFAAAELHEAVSLAARTALSDVLSEADFSVLQDQASLSERVKRRAASEFDHYGSELKGIYVTEAARVDSETDGQYSIDQAHVLGNYLIDAAHILAGNEPSSGNGRDRIPLPIALGPTGEPFTATASNGNGSSNY